MRVCAGESCVRVVCVCAGESCARVVCVLCMYMTKKFVLKC